MTVGICWRWLLNGLEPTALLVSIFPGMPRFQHGSLELAYLDQGEGVGWYGEGGVHFMFPSRYSIILNGMYRHAKATQVFEETTFQRLYNIDGTPYTIDPSGFGIRLAVQISLFGKPAQ